MENDNVIERKGTYLDETFASQIIGISIEEIRTRVSCGRLKGFLSSGGIAKVLSDDVYFTTESMALSMHVSKEDVIEWIKSGQLKAEQSEEDYKISYKEYSRFGQSGMWMAKFHDKMFDYMKELINNGGAIEEVNNGFRLGMKPHITKAHEVIEYLEQIHKNYEKNINIHEKTAKVAAIVIIARVISILYSALNLIEKGEVVGASALFRVIYEGENLAKYFIFSEGTINGKCDLDKWFKGVWIRNAICQKYLVKYYREAGFDKSNTIQDLQTKLYDLYSRLTHPNYDSIMESYNMFSSSGPGGNKAYRMGFDYKSAMLLRKSVVFLGCFERLLQSVLNTFILCFKSTLPMENNHIQKLIEYNQYYQKSVAERNKEIKSQSEHLK